MSKYLDEKLKRILSNQDLLFYFMFGGFTTLEGAALCCLIVITLGSGLPVLIFQLRALRRGSLFQRKLCLITSVCVVIVQVTSLIWFLVFKANRTRLGEKFNSNSAQGFQELWFEFLLELIRDSLFFLTGGLTAFTTAFRYERLALGAQNMRKRLVYLKAYRYFIVVVSVSTAVLINTGNFMYKGNYKRLVLRLSIGAAGLWGIVVLISDIYFNILLINVTINSIQKMNVKAKRKARLTLCATMVGIILSIVVDASLYLYGVFAARYQDRIRNSFTLMAVSFATIHTAFNLFLLEAVRSYVVNNRKDTTTTDSSSNVSPSLKDVLDRKPNLVAEASYQLDDAPVSRFDSHFY